MINSIVKSNIYNHIIYIVNIIFVQSTTFCDSLRKTPCLKSQIVGFLPHHHFVDDAEGCGFSPRSVSSKSHKKRPSLTRESLVLMTFGGTGGLFFLHCVPKNALWRKARSSWLFPWFVSLISVTAVSSPATQIPHA